MTYVSVEIDLDDIKFSKIVDYVESNKNNGKMWRVVEKSEPLVKAFKPTNLIQQQMIDAISQICNSSKLNDLEKLAKFEAIKKEIGI